MGRRLGIALWAAWVLGSASPALAWDPAAAAPVPEPVAAASPERRPVWCTPLGCRRAPSAAWTWVAGFGAAAWGAWRLTRKRPQATR